VVKKDNGRSTAIHNTYVRWRTFYFGQVTQTMLWDESIVVSQHVSRNFNLGFGFGRTGGDALRALDLAVLDTGSTGFK
jgi:hypothetical protein